MTLMHQEQSKRLPPRISLLAIGATALFAGCGSDDQPQRELESPNLGMCSAGGCWDDRSGSGGGGGAVCEETGCVDDGENTFGSRPCTADVTELAPSDGFLTTFMGDDGVTSRLVAIPSESPSAPEFSTDDGALHITVNTEATSMQQYPG